MDVGSLLGVLVGGLITLVVSLVLLRSQVHAERETRRQDRLVDVVAEVWVAADDMWEAFRDAASSRLALSGGPSAEHEQQQQEADTRSVVAERETRRLAAKLRLLAPELAKAADELIFASGPMPPDGIEEAEQYRNEALWGFEDAARTVLDVNVPEDAQVRPTGRGGK